MSFKSQFSASQDKAHNRDIATKIHEEMTKLRAGVDASPTTPRRWVWELIQNAKDVNIDGRVPFEHVTGSHPGSGLSDTNERKVHERTLNSIKRALVESAPRVCVSLVFSTGTCTSGDGRISILHDIGSGLRAT